MYKKLVVNRKWIWLVLVSLAVTLVSFYPQLTMLRVRGSQWNGSFAQTHGDEWLYSAYVESLIEGRSRRNDPYTGRDNKSPTREPESLFSIQYVPAYIISGIARTIGLSASGSFIGLALIAPFLSSLAIFWLVFALTHDYKFSIAAAVIILSFGTLVGGEGAVSLLGSNPYYVMVPFLRRYEPAAMFPLIFIFCGCVWKSLSRDGPVGYVWAISAGIGLVLLIFSYFYLWTSAAAWLATVVSLHILPTRNKRIRNLSRVGIICAFGLAALVPYYVLLSNRSSIMDRSQQLVSSHAPDLLRVPEIFALLNIVIFVFVVKKKGLDWRAPEWAMVSSFLGVPFVVFNQQVITGLSLQPFHFEIFIVNYLVLTGAVLGAYLICRKSELDWKLSTRHQVRLIVVALCWLLIEVALHTDTIVSDSHFVDQAALVGHRLKDLSQYGNLDARSALNPQPLVLAVDPKVAVLLPTFAPQALLWSPNFGLINLQPNEGRTRFYLFLYYSGVDTYELGKILKNERDMLTAFAFGPGRNIPGAFVRPISQPEISAKVSDYSDFCAKLSSETIATYSLSYIVAPQEGADLTNVDRWYDRDVGQQIGPYIIYRVRLR